MEFEELKQIMELFSKCEIDRFELEREGLSLKLGKKKPEVTAVAPVFEAPQAGVASAPPVAAAPVKEEEDENLIYVASPIVGTFYRSPNPNAAPFVEIGDRARQGQTLCIVEAMKLMNEIQADHAGEIVKVFVENGQGVEFGQNLFALKPL